MAWCPFATKIEVQPESDAQPAIKPTQGIVHSLAAPWSGPRTADYWREPGVNVESHAYVEYDGDIFQFIGTETRADANMHANRRSDGTGAISMETASNIKHTDAWTDAQIESIIRWNLWLHEKHKIPLRMCRTWDDSGFGYHRMFPQWSVSGTDCPGDARVSQFRELIFPEMLTRVNKSNAPTSPSETPPKFPGRQHFYVGAYNVFVTWLDKGLIRHGFTRHHDGDGYQAGPRFTEWTVRNVRDAQVSYGWSGSDADGYPGPETWRRLVLS